jgi:hypothetical protein
MPDDLRTSLLTAIVWSRRRLHGASTGPAESSFA